MEEKKTKAQLRAAQNKTALGKRVLAKLGKKGISMRQLAAKLGMSTEDGSVKPSVATKIRTAINDLGSAVIREGKLSSTTYRKA